MKKINKVLLYFCTLLFGIFSCFLVFLLFWNLFYKSPRENVEVAVKSMVEEYAKAYCKANDMQFLGLGNFLEGRNKIEFAMRLRSFSKQELQEVRSQAIALVQNFYKKVQTDESPKIYVESLKQLFPRQYSEISVSDLDLIGVKIVFWDKNFDRPVPPYVAEMVFYNKTFHYYEADPNTQSLHLVFEETYQDSLG
jgi:hypothetical protein